MAPLSLPPNGQEPSLRPKLKTLSEPLRENVRRVRVTLDLDRVAARIREDHLAALSTRAHVLRDGLHRECDSSRTELCLEVNEFLGSDDGVGSATRRIAHKALPAVGVARSLPSFEVLAATQILNSSAQVRKSRKPIVLSTGGSKRMGWRRSHARCGEAMSDRRDAVALRSSRSAARAPLARSRG